MQRRPHHGVGNTGEGRFEVPGGWSGCPTLSVQGPQQGEVMDRKGPYST